MVENNRTVGGKTRHQLFTRLWWGSIPVLIAAQGVVWAHPEYQVASTNSLGRPHTFWSVEDNGNHFSSELFQEALNSGSDTLPPGTLHGTIAEEKNTDEIEWFTQKQQPSGRFAVPEEVFDKCGNSLECPSPSLASCDLFLCHNHSSERVSCVASSLCCGQSCRQSHAWTPRLASNSSPWIQGSFTGQLICPSCFTDEPKISPFLCVGHTDACQGQSSDYYAAPATVIVVQGEEWMPDLKGHLTDLPSILCVGDATTCSTKASPFSIGSSLSDIAIAITEVSPSTQGRQTSVPSLLSSEGVAVCTGFGCGGTGAYTSTENIVLGHSEGAHDQQVVDSKHQAHHLTDIPPLICFGCDVISATGGLENDCGPGACGLSETENTDIAPSLLAFTSIPKPACNRCGLLTPAGDLAQSDTVNPQSLYRHSAYSRNGGTLGRETQLQTDSLAISDCTHLEQPLGQDSVDRVHRSIRKPTDEMVTAPSISLAFDRQKDSCVGECSPTQPYLTSHHPTAARAAFDGTGYDHLQDIQHLTAFAPQSSVTDPSSAHLTSAGASTRKAKSSGETPFAPQVFWSLSKKDHHQTSRHNTHPSPPAPNTNAWGSWDTVLTEALSSTENIAGDEHITEEALTQTPPKTMSKPWQMFDNIVSQAQPAYAHIPQTKSSPTSTATLAPLELINAPHIPNEPAFTYETANSSLTDPQVAPQQAVTLATTSTPSFDEAAFSTPSSDLTFTPKLADETPQARQENTQHLSSGYALAQAPHNASSPTDIVGNTAAPLSVADLPQQMTASVAPQLEAQPGHPNGFPPATHSPAGFRNHTSGNESQQQLAASAQPSASEPAPLTAERLAEYGLTPPGFGPNDGLVAATADLNAHIGQRYIPEGSEAQLALSSRTSNTGAGVELSADTEHQELLRKAHAMSTLSGSEPLRPPTCAERLKESSQLAGETIKPSFDSKQLKQLTASVQPSDLGVHESRPTPRFSPAPGTGSQRITSEGKVPGGLDIASGQTGVRHSPVLDDGITVVRSAQDSKYRVNPYASPNLNTGSEHLGVSGMVTAAPGASTSSPWADEAVNWEGKTNIGLYSHDEVVHSALDLQPSLGDAWGVNRAALREGPETHASIHLREAPSTTSSDLIATADNQAGADDRYNGFYKVVDVSETPSPRVKVGKSSAKESGLFSAEGDGPQRFSVEVHPVAPHAEPASMQQLLGRVRRQAPQTSSSEPSSSFLIGLAHASSRDNDQHGGDQSHLFSVGVPSRHYDQPGGWYHEDEQQWKTENGSSSRDAGFDTPNSLGVRREGHVSDQNGPWLQEDESYDDSPFFEEAHTSASPPGEYRSNASPQGAQPYWGNNAESTEREPKGSLQKKNRSFTSRYSEQSEEGESRPSSDSKTDLSEAPSSPQADTSTEELSSESSDAVSAQGKKALKQGLEPFHATRDLSPESSTNELIAQESIFKSGTPSSAPQSFGNDDEEEEEEEEVDPGFTINFRDVPITEYIRFVSGLTHQNFIFNDDELDFSITVISDEPTSTDNIMAALLQELRIHGLSVIEQGNNIIIHKSAARGPAQIITDPKAPSVNEARLVTRVFQLDAVDPEIMKGIVAPMLSGQALVQVLADTKNLLVTDFAGNVEQIAALIKTLDLPATTFEVGQYVGVNNFIENLIPLAEEIIRPIAEGQRMVFVPHLATNSVFVVSAPLLVKRALAILQRLDSLEGQTNIMTLDDLSLRGDALVTPDNAQFQRDSFFEDDEDFSSDERLEEERLRLERLVDGREEEEQQQELTPFARGTEPRHETRELEERRYEEPLEEDDISQTKFFIHKLRYRQGDQLTDALLRISDSLRLSEKANIDLINAINSIQWIESSNSLVVTGTSDALGRVKELVEEIDTPLRQVFLEMLILDTTIGDSLNYSVDFTSEFHGMNVGGAQGWSGNAPPTGQTNPLFSAVGAASDGVTTDDTTGAVAQTLIDASNLAGATLPGFNLGIIGRRVLKNGNFFNSMGALVQSLHTDQSAEIVLNPKIMVEDNHEAEIFVGQNTAFQTNNTVNNDGTIISQNVEFRDIGTRMSVRPQIGTNNVITLEIEQEVSQAVSTSSGGGTGGGSVTQSPGPTTATSRTVTKVHVPNGYFVILSGMVREEKSNLRRQLPCLGGLPIIGAAGSSQGKTLAKRNLMIFIRPQIIETEWDFDDVTKRQQRIYKDKRSRRPRWKYEVDEGLDFLNLPRVNERCEEECYLPGYADDWGTGCDCY